VKKCDVCQAETDDLTRLRGEYQDDGLRDICYDCNREVSEVLDTTTRAIYKLESRARHRTWLQWLAFRRVK
jgi:hypothetical protein